jgi:hypothetical protein
LIPSLAVALVALAASQTGGDGAAPVAEGSLSTSERTGEARTRFANPEQTGIPFQPYATIPPSSQGGISMDLGVESAVRVRTLADTGSGTFLGADVEVTPGVSLSVELPILKLATGYAVRMTIPLQSSGESLAALNSAYLRAVWQPAVLWTLTAEGTGTFGQFSQLYPVTTPGGSGPPAAALDPVRWFATYPYIGLNAAIRAESPVAPRSRLRFSAGYSDVGGVGDAGGVSGAQPRVWGPLGEAAWDWEASPASTLTTSATGVNSIMAGNFFILVGVLKETLYHRWSGELETTLAIGLGASNTASITFLTVGHLLPIAGAGLRYFTDVEHQFRLSLDVSLAPYVDPYVRVAYQRVSGNLGLDWYPMADLFVGAALSAAWVPYSVKAPESYGTGGISAGWAIGKIFTIGAGAFTQSQFQGASDGGGFFRQWTTYVSLTLRDRIWL